MVSLRTKPGKASEGGAWQADRGASGGETERSQAIAYG